MPAGKASPRRILRPLPSLVLGFLFCFIVVTDDEPLACGKGVAYSTKQEERKRRRNAWVQSPRRCTKKRNDFLGSRFFFIQSEGLAWNRRAKCGAWNPSLCDGMASRFFVHLLRIDSIHHFVMIPFAPSSRFHTATSCGFHPRLCRDFMVRLL